MEKVHCQYEQERKERQPIEGVKGKSATWTIRKGSRIPQ